MGSQGPLSSSQVGGIPFFVVVQQRSSFLTRNSVGHGPLSATEAVCNSSPCSPRGHFSIWLFAFFEASRSAPTAAAFLFKDLPDQFRPREPHLPMSARSQWIRNTTTGMIPHHIPRLYPCSGSRNYTGYVHQWEGSLGTIQNPVYHANFNSVRQVAGKVILL